LTQPPDSTNPGSFTSLRQLARQATANAEEHCELCGEVIGPEHQHLLDISTRELQCTCRACALLFDRPAAGAGVRRLVPSRSRYLLDFDLSDGVWETLRIPVNMAFFTYNSAAERVLALYPGPMGPTESLLTLEAWTELEERNPILKEMERDVEALLVHRVREARDHFLVPIDECYKLVGIIRLHWRGLSGGREVWGEIDSFFAGLKARARPVGAPDA
jgi:uncharacterized protein DUF5947